MEQKKCNVKSSTKNQQSKKLISISSHKIILSFICILFTMSFYAQKRTNSITKIFLSQNRYIHNLQIEKFFLHTNKTTYYPGEKVWFKAYVVNDSDNKLSLETTNLHVNFYDAQKNLISNQLFLVESGTTHGEIELPTELDFGTYFIELTTQWNQNFDNNASITSIQVLSASQKAKTISSSINSENGNTQVSDGKNVSFDIQFFPESNILLENIENKIAFTSKNNSSAVSISGDIIDNKTGIIVAKIESNQFGMGDFELYYRPNRTYTAFVNYNGIQKEFAIPKAQLNGVVITKNKHQTDDDSIDFTLKTNESTIKTDAGDYVFAVLHRNGNQNVVIPIQLKKKYISYSFNIFKSHLFKGINTITLFSKSNKPIASYSFYNNNTKNIDIEVTSIAKEKDSLTLNFDLINGTANTNVSISLLPVETKLYSNQSSIETAFLIAPYLENAHLNLTDIFKSANSSENIDLLIQTSIKKNTLPYKKPISPRDRIILAENGMSVRGNVSSNVKNLTNYRVMLSSKENDILLIEPIRDSNKFAFDNLIIKDSTNYKLALLDPQGEILKTGFLLKNELIAYKANQNLEKTTEVFEKEKEIEYTDVDYSFQPILEDVTILDEVKITGYQKRKNELLELGINPDILHSDFSQLYVIKENEIALLVFDYLQILPSIRVIGDANLGFAIYNRRGSSSLMNTPPMAIFVDGIHSIDSEILLSRMASDFIAIDINLSGAGAGVFGQGGVISFYTRHGKYGDNKDFINSDIIISETDFGFSTATDTYENNLMFANEISRKYYGTIGWIPDYNITLNNTNHLKFNTNGFKNIKVIINGINTDGDVIFKIVDIKSTSD